jgi:hypothetical protein
MIANCRTRSSGAPDNAKSAERRSPRSLFHSAFHNCQRQSDVPHAVQRLPASRQSWIIEQAVRGVSELLDNPSRSGRRTGLRCSCSRMRSEEALEVQRIFIWSATAAAHPFRHRPKLGSRDGLSLDRIHILQGFQRHLMSLFLLIDQAARACFITQPLDRSRREAIASTLSASLMGTCAVKTFVSVAMIYHSLSL